jgi:hypothetical protein
VPWIGFVKKKKECPSKEEEGDLDLKRIFIFYLEVI